ALETAKDIATELCERRLRRGGQRPDHDVGPVAHLRRRLVADGLETTPHGVSRHRAADRLAHDEAEARRARFAGVDDVQHVDRARAPRAPPDDRSIVDPAGEALRSGEHVRRAARDYAESSVRPLLRRAFTIARPARVRIRARKPCFLARRRLLGWKVRLLIAFSLREDMSPELVQPETSYVHAHSGHKSTDIDYVGRVGRCKPRSEPVSIPTADAPRRERHADPARKTFATSGRHG